MTGQAPFVGWSMKPSYVLSRAAPGPGCQPDDWASTGGAMLTASARHVPKSSAAFETSERIDSSSLLPNQ